jgi:hypothetical protein
MLKNLFRWDAAKWEKDRLSGQLHFILFYGVLEFGFAVLATLTLRDLIADLISQEDCIKRLFDYKNWIVNAFIAVGAGWLRGGMEWNYREFSYKKRTKGTPNC